MASRTRTSTSTSLPRATTRLRHRPPPPVLPVVRQLLQVVIPPLGRHVLELRAASIRADPRNQALQHHRPAVSHHKRPRNPNSRRQAVLGRLLHRRRSSRRRHLAKVLNSSSRRRPARVPSSNHKPRTRKRRPAAGTSLNRRMPLNSSNSSNSRRTSRPSNSSSPPTPDSPRIRRTHHSSPHRRRISSRNSNRMASSSSRATNSSSHRKSLEEWKGRRRQISLFGMPSRHPQQPRTRQSLPRPMPLPPSTHRHPRAPTPPTTHLRRKAHPMHPRPTADQRRRENLRLPNPVRIKHLPRHRILEFQTLLRKNVQQT